MGQSGFRSVLVAVFSTLILATSMCGVVSAAVRSYYIAADEVNWDYMPGGADKVGVAKAYAKYFSTRGPHLIGHVYREAIYRQYTDATFKHLKSRKPQDAYLGILGPIIYAEVGDTIRATRSESSSRTTLRIRAACICTGSSMPKHRRGRPTMTEFRCLKIQATASRLEVASRMCGGFHPVLARDRPIQARSYGSITRMCTNCRTSTRA